MNEREFKESLHLGLGRALLYARDNDVRAYRDVILDACLHCYSYDVQCEGTRADWMYELVGLLPDKVFYHDAVLNSLAISGDDDDAVQRFRFATRMVKDGDENAGRVMHESYHPGPRNGEKIGINFLHTDEIAGLSFVAEKMGALVLAEGNVVDVGWPVSVSKEAVGEQATWDALREAGRENRQIEAYRQACEVADKPRRKNSTQEDLSSMPYAELLEKMPANMPGRLWKWGEQASDDELVLAARGLIAAQDPKEQLRHTRIFTRRPFPLPPGPLITLAGIEAERVGFWAVRALAHNTDPAVRDLAFRLIKSDLSWRGEAIALLNKNFERGDHEIVLGWFNAEEDVEVRHSLEMDLRQFWEQHPDEKTEVRMLQSLYEKGPCFVCRERAVERLIELNALTKQMLTECACDANDDIRDLVREPSATS